MRERCIPALITDLREVSLRCRSLVGSRKGATIDEAGDRVMQSLDEIIRQNTADAPTQPGVYLMPCGACVVDFFLTAEGEERWLVAGDGGSYSRETVATYRHGDAGWRRLLTLEDAAAELLLRAAEAGVELDSFVRDLSLGQSTKGN